MSTNRLSSIFNWSPKSNVTQFSELSLLYLILYQANGAANGTAIVDKEPPALPQEASKALKELREHVSKIFCFSFVIISQACSSD